MLKKINQLLKLVGFNLVHAKKPKAYAIKGTRTSRTSRVCYIPGPAGITGAAGKDYVPSPACCVDEYNAKSTGRTYPARSAFTAVGEGVSSPTDDCKGGYSELREQILARAKNSVSNKAEEVIQQEISRLSQPSSDNNITGPTS